ncbi:MAG: M23 family metallopeptidase [Marinobacter sp.]|nr:M23 family metallopeptidase [Marinobacter sp.]MDR9424444.1 M23 family metallopeptidase [Marinobacter sp.]
MNVHGSKFFAGLAGLLLTVALVAGGAGYQLAISQSEEQNALDAEQKADWQQKLQQQKAEVARIRETVQQQVDTLTLRIGRIHGRLLRLDALGQRFIESGLVTGEEFNFDQPAAVGGPAERLGVEESYSAPELTDMINQLEYRLEDREKQLRLLDKLANREKFQDERYVQGRPVNWGWVSSKYGYRSDPFTGKRAWHAGIDMAGRQGGDIISVAGGVVSFSGDRYGYGNMVEVRHGDGLVTRYAHADSLLVEAGDVVQKDQLIARMGSTGRSTGPHVHFEVIRNGRTEDPEKYMQRASR